ncbi:hypothetical protein [Streptomyces sp. URMC 129]|uniref:hypothetical protein n=1 Tax=Streptomyces sp. URMC 129 TaxID=3423407 RepID=UPI003F197EED
MTIETTQLVPAKRPKRRPLRSKQPAVIELSAISVRPEVHFTRPWSASSDEVSTGFRLVVLPARLLALSLLWATSSPQRLSIAAACAACSPWW